MLNLREMTGEEFSVFQQKGIQSYVEERKLQFTAESVATLRDWLAQGQPWNRREPKVSRLSSFKRAVTTKVATGRNSH